MFRKLNLFRAALAAFLLGLPLADKVIASDGFDIAVSSIDLASDITRASLKLS